MVEFYEMPAISPTMEVGSLVAWKVAEGDPFESGTVLAEIGTDKANMEAEIFEDGVLIKQLIAEGDEVPPGFPIAIWGESGDEDISSLLEAFAQKKAEGMSAPSAASEPASPAPAATTAAPTPPRPMATMDIGSVKRSWMGDTLDASFMDPPGDLRLGQRGERIAASPLARKIARELGVNLRHVQGTGPGGRIVRADVESAPPTRLTSTSPSHVSGGVQVRNSPMRKTIARRLLASHQDIPTFFLTAVLEMDALVEMRASIKASNPDSRVSYNDFVVKATAHALADHPEVNASWGEESITQHTRVDIGVAVAIEGGLITPVVRGADGKSLEDINGEIRDLATRAKALRLKPEEYTGSTFTISNLGMFGIEQFTAIINPPEAAILAVGGIQQEMVMRDGIWTGAHRMRVTMTCDHRVIDGAVGAGFLQTLRGYVENPQTLSPASEES